MEKRLQVITGGTSGMGLATAKALSVYGPVLIGGRSEKRLASAMAELKEADVDIIHDGGKTALAFAKQMM